MAEILGANIPVPSFGIGSGSIIWVLIILMFVIASAVIIYIVHLYRTYNLKIVVFENLSGAGFQPTFKDRARIIKVGDGGEEVLFLMKKKVFRTAYGRKMGKNTYWFTVGQDGYWYNSVLGDFDAKMGMLDIEPIDRDMRYANVAVRKNIVDRYRKVSFMEKYGTMMMTGLFLLIMIVGIWFLLDKMGEISGTINEGMKASEKVMESAKQIISSLDNIKTGGSGIVPAG